MRAPPRPASSNRVDAEVARIGKENEAMNTSTTPDVLAPRRSTPENLSAIKESLGEVAVNEKERLQGAVARTKDRFVQAEDKFGVKIPDDELANLRTVGDAVAYIEANKS